ncbi:MAG: CDP-alcohol phosphatidyltransferase family protein [Candidatus Uhrbacteria bacterium]|nr:CDP-alcohol phosphatidyltransferase family protein [Candidatus Uhrbacteria bacterium]
MLRFIPHTVTPNLVTVFRFIMIPFVLLALLTGHIPIALILFAIAAFSDAVDGALARTRHQVTDWGKIYDPLADKLLVGSVAAILVTLYVNPLAAFILIALELILIVVAMWKRTVERKVFQAHWSGKVKMVAQSLALLALFLYMVTGYKDFVDLGTLLVYAAIAFSLVSLVVYRSV